MSLAIVLPLLLGCRAELGPLAPDDPCRGPDARACEDATLAADLRCETTGVCKTSEAPPRDACRVAIERAMADHPARRVELWTRGDRCRAARASVPRRDGVLLRATPPPHGPRWRCPGRCGPPDRTWIEIADASENCARVRVRSGFGGSSSRICVDDSDRVVIDEVVLW